MQGVPGGAAARPRERHKSGHYVAAVVVRAHQQYLEAPPPSPTMATPPWACGGAWAPQPPSPATLPALAQSPPLSATTFLLSAPSAARLLLAARAPPRHWRARCSAPQPPPPVAPVPSQLSARWPLSSGSAALTARAPPAPLPPHPPAAQRRGSPAALPPRPLLLSVHALQPPPTTGCGTHATSLCAARARAAGSGCRGHVAPCLRPSPSTCTAVLGCASPR